MNNKDRKNLVLSMIKQGNKFNGGNIIYKYPDLLNDEEVLFAAAKRGLDLKKEIPSKILENKKFVKLLLSKRIGFQNFCFLKDRKSKYCDDKEIILAALKRTPDTLRYLKENFKNDEQIVMTAIKSWKPGQMYICPIPYGIGKKLAANRKFILRAIRYWGGSILYANKKLINDRKLFIKAIKLLKKQKEPISIQDINNGSAEKYYKDKEFVEEAIKTSPEIYEKIDNKLKLDKKITISVVRKMGRYLQYAPKEMRADRDIVFNSFNCKDMESFEFMDKKFKNDTKLILHAIKNCQDASFPHLDNGDWFWTHVDKKLLKNKSFILEAIKCNPRAYGFFDRILFDENGVLRDDVDPDIKEAREIGWKKSFESTFK